MGAVLNLVQNNLHELRVDCHFQKATARNIKSRPHGLF